MLKREIIDQELYRLALDEEVPTQRLSFPMYAPHFCDDLHSQKSHNSGDVRTTIDCDIQQMAVKLLDRHISPLKSKGITNGAVVIIDNATCAVKALVGSADYFDVVNCGQVNGARSPRCPGSTLKPFAYGLGFELGLISPSSLLFDVPVDYAGYQPKNYDETYHGMVTVTEALTQSMNVPAVNLVDQVGYGQLFHLLEHRLSTLDQPMEYYGLPLILGGVGVTLLDIANLYAALANGGDWRPYRILEDDPIVGGDSLFSAATCYLLTDLLTQVRRPDFPECWESSVHLPKIAWKTGTSYGHRDAWSIGYSPRYTIGVWVGNFPGDGNPLLVGAEIAGPLLFDIAQGLEPEPDHWFQQPDDVGEREVCVVSGMVPGPYCDATHRVLYIKNRSSHRVCDMHVSYAIDDDSGCRLCPHCQVNHKYHYETFVQFPPELATWMQEQGYTVDAIPEHNPLCRQGVNGPGPVIVSPSEDCHYIVRNGIPLQDQQILFHASVPNEINTIYWFVDGELLYKGRPGTPIFYTPEKGSHEVVCMDNEGRQSSRILVVI
jgi:penicillin-binding protein 1C